MVNIAFRLGRLCANIKITNKQNQNGNIKSEKFVFRMDAGC